MGSVKSKSGKAQSNKKSNKKLIGLYLVAVVPITLIFCLVIYLVLQGVMERLGLSPIIMLSPSGSWMTSGEAILMYVLWLGVSISLGTILAYLLIRKLAD